MSTRSYLSIGDVLSLLREEFPDVTISKIRFLESQGLVDPERSPSGYRKFYDHDVDRLRWVLRQQRDQFLPLKVIRDRLAAAGDGLPADEPGDVGGQGGAEEQRAQDPGEAAWTNGGMSQAQSAASERSAPTAPAAEERSLEAAGPWRRAEPEGPNVVRLGPERRLPASEHPAASAPGGSEPATPAAQSVEARPAAIRSAPGDSEAGPYAPGEPASNRTANPPAASAEARRGGVRGVPVAVEEPAPEGLFARQAPHEARPARGGVGSGERWTAEPKAATPSGEVHGQAADDQPRRPTAPQGAATAGGDASRALSGGVSGVSLSPGELAAATGLSPQTLANLEGFGLIAPMAIAGDTFYDEEALTVAKLVVAFAKFGIEPRHLRLYRNAVDREVGLVEQVITPLLRQRNPEARQRAMDAAAELTRLGQGLRAALVRTELRRQFGG